MTRCPERDVSWARAKSEDSGISSEGEGRKIVQTCYQFAIFFMNLSVIPQGTAAIFSSRWVRLKRRGAIGG